MKVQAGPGRSTVPAMVGGGGFFEVPMSIVPYCHSGGVKKARLFQGKDEAFPVLRRPEPTEEKYADEESAFATLIANAYTAKPQKQILRFRSG